jgi:hypothetical protein
MYATEFWTEICTKLYIFVFFFVTLVAISSCMSEVNKEMQYSHKILSVVFKFLSLDVMSWQYGSNLIGF